METSRFCFELPPELIAQRPAAQRSAARLMVLEQGGGALRHLRVRDLPGLLPRGALLVLNDTRVLHARLTGRLPGGAEASFLLLEPELGGRRWTALAPGARRLAARAGGQVSFPAGVTAAVAAAGEGVAGEGALRLTFSQPVDAGYLERHGAVPLPPYVRRAADRADAERYQTVYAANPGSAAAPTAGLHFTPALLRELEEERGVIVARVTLHVGAGTFTPIRTARVEDHVMHRERYLVPEAAALALAAARRDGRPVVAVGTTVVRTLESAWDGAAVRPGAGSSGLFIYPGYRFRVVDQLLTNFHTPGSSLLALVAALAGEASIRAAYAAAVARRYRFFSYGDAMLIR